MDDRTAEARSMNMARIASKDTSCEMTVRRLLHSLGLRFRLHKKDLPGCPDIVMKRYSAAIFRARMLLACA